MMQAVHFGAGNIGKGFIGDLLHDSGFYITFVEVNDAVVQSINRTNSYDIYVIDKNYEKRTINNVSALSSGEEEITEAILDADMVTTSVWADNLAKVAPVIAKGLQKRIDNKKEKLNILACENALYATDILKKEILKNLKADESELNNYACFPNVSVDRRARNIIKDGEPAVEIDSSFELVIEKNKLVNPDTEPIKGAIYAENLTMYLERKLYIVNCGHAAAAYLGFLKGYKIVQDALKDKEILEEVLGAMNESAAVLQKKFGFSHEDLQKFIQKNIKRFTSEAVKDDILRVGRSPIRKLDPTDRLVAPALGCIEYNYETKYLSKIIAAVFHYENPNDEQAVILKKYLDENGIEKSITNFTKIQKGTKLFDEISEKF